jgi:hypothetical protein
VEFYINKHDLRDIMRWCGEKEEEVIEPFSDTTEQDRKFLEFMLKGNNALLHRWKSN